MKHTHNKKATTKQLDVHDLHVWTIVGSKVNMWAHLTVESTADQTQVRPRHAAKLAVASHAVASHAVASHAVASQGRQCG